MKKKKNITNYSVSEIKHLKEQGADLTNWSKVDQLANAKSKVSANDEDDIGIVNWETIKIGIPDRKRDIHIRLDADLLDWLKKSGKGYQTRINAILRSYMQATR